MNHAHFPILFRPIGLDENTAVQQAINESIQQLGHSEEMPITIDEEPDDLEDENVVALIKEHSTKIVQGDARSVVVSRLSIWETAKSYFMRQKFLQKNGLLRVTFATFEGQEDAVDHGGPRREFFHLLLGAMSKESGTLFSKLVRNILSGTYSKISNVCSQFLRKFP